jgi:hypothetical protein
MILAGYFMTRPYIHLARSDIDELTKKRLEPDAKIPTDNQNQDQVRGGEEKQNDTTV